MGLRYGQGKYSTFRYGRQSPGFQFSVKISDSSGNLLAFLNNEEIDLEWSYKRFGGCSKFKCTLKRQFDVLTNLTAMNLHATYDIQVYITPDEFSTSQLYYRGMINDIRPNLKDNETVVLSGTGYGVRLQEIIMHDGTGAPKEYTNTTISALITSIFNDFVDPNTSITLGDVDTYSTPITSIKFNGTVEEAISKLAKIVDAEWGVDRNLDLYFVAPSEAIGFRWFVGRDIGYLSDEIDYSEVVNRVLIEGGDIDDGTGSGDTVPFRYVKSHDASIASYGLKEKIVRNSSVIDATVAEKLATSVLDKQSQYQRNSEINLPFNQELIEDNVPIPLVAILKNPTTRLSIYGTFKYGEKKYSGTPTNQIYSITYTLKDLSLDTTVELNFGKPDIITNFNLLEFELEQQRQAAGV